MHGPLGPDMHGAHACLWERCCMPPADLCPSRSCLGRVGGGVRFERGGGLAGALLWTASKPLGFISGEDFSRARCSLVFLTGPGGSSPPPPNLLRSAKTRVLKSKTRVPKHAFSKHSVAAFLLFSVIRQRFGLRAKNARAENALVNYGMQPNAETICVLGCVLKRQRFDNAFWHI